ncbi:ABC transporter ATP-binding protein [Prauserella muralis]|uniref:ABC-type quaternary amine transporter n=1 Tax=Prauserella muralis TaxID=588067 RepID=A0A2V4AQD3_9PSEU|nr:ABC transporter ATP-binding protein [Prauserella muralis]PXY21336.1 Fe3+/spermidine/putrescine ABC transporter ATP-binding protein [Prauserella muralis]TWE30462.1 iron(III) transport system ATP-binding protein [Prauserella muralis]
MDVLPTSESADPVVRVEHLAKRFRRRDGSTVDAIDDVSFDVQAGDLVVLLGPSGCGKTTLLRSIAGLETPDDGVISFGDRVQFSPAEGINVPPERRGVSMVFQSYALWPHMTAFRNVAYPLESRGPGRRNKAETAKRVRRALGLVGIPELEQQYAAQMSGGQQQRVALARALVSNDALVLFDEPLSNVDAKVREQLRVELLSLQRELGFAAIFVTHDQSEAMQLGTRIAVLNKGRIVQLASPLEVYTKPANQYVAKFVGTMNEVLGTVTATKGETAEVKTDLGVLTGRIGGGVDIGDHVAAMWRPESATLSTDEPVAANRLAGRVKASLFLGAATEQVITVDGREVRVQVPGAAVLPGGSDVWIEISEADLLVLPAEDA